MNNFNAKTKKSVSDLAPKRIPEEELDVVSGGITGIGADEIFASGVVESGTVSLYDEKGDARSSQLSDSL